MLDKEKWMDSYLTED